MIMELYKTFSRVPFERYEDYLSMVRNGDYRKIKVDNVRDVKLYRYEHTITRNMTNVELPLQNGIYNFINENEPFRHFYGSILNEKIMDVYFDQEQINRVDELIMAEYSKTEILSKQAFHYSIQHQEVNEQLKNEDEIESYRIWDDVINKIYDDVDLDCFTKDEEELSEEKMDDYYYEI